MVSPGRQSRVLHAQGGWIPIPMPDRKSKVNCLTLPPIHTYMHNGKSWALLKADVQLDLVPRPYNHVICPGPFTHRRGPGIQMVIYSILSGKDRVVWGKHQLFLLKHSQNSEGLIEVRILGRCALVPCWRIS